MFSFTYNTWSNVYRLREGNDLRDLLELIATQTHVLKKRFLFQSDVTNIIRGEFLFLFSIVSAARNETDRG